MQFDRCSRPECGRPFQANQFGAQFSISAQCGKITCPHCGATSHGDNNSIFLTHALTEAQEAQFDSTHPAGAGQGRSWPHRSIPPSGAG